MLGCFFLQHHKLVLALQSMIPRTIVRSRTSHAIPRWPPSGDGSFRTKSKEPQERHFQGPGSVLFSWLGYNAQTAGREFTLSRRHALLCLLFLIRLGPRTRMYLFACSSRLDDAVIYCRVASPSMVYHTSSMGTEDSRTWRKTCLSCLKAPRVSNTMRSTRREIYGGLSTLVVDFAASKQSPDVPNNSGLATT
ncbi:hypothetical protein BU23DRAFT_186151 [Bimuria novae-zelandiae CBS 107.79]|uniref:Uncharacterized protein n=1 Tax=Bimuria novae-zelandiae CBS 107.79 TaxID=1447943 RepID=A0A6A5V2T5_9PLEO|nr:hypothetical protein BU23DRAFT_186151 [Bimuria novae-zelandiae CBS 107.79]